MNIDKHKLSKEIINNKSFIEGTFDHLMNHKLIKLEENYVETQIEINESHLQPFGLVHGEYIARWLNQQYLMELL